MGDDHNHSHGHNAHNTFRQLFASLLLIKFRKFVDKIHFCTAQTCDFSISRYTSPAETCLPKSTYYKDWVGWGRRLCRSIADPGLGDRGGLATAQTYMYIRPWGEGRWGRVRRLRRRAITACTVVQPVV